MWGWILKTTEIELPFISAAFRYLNHLTKVTVPFRCTIFPL